MAILSDGNTVGDVYFRLFSTKFPGSKSLLEWEDATDSEERILFDEDTQTASLVEDTVFDPTLKTIVVAQETPVNCKLTGCCGNHIVKLQTMVGYKEYLSDPFIRYWSQLSNI